MQKKTFTPIFSAAFNSHSVPSMAVDGVGEPTVSWVDQAGFHQCGHLRPHG